MKGITIVGLGPGNGRLLTRQAWDCISQTETLYLRTQRHPAIADLPPQVRCVSFDHLYETADQFETVYAQIVADLLAHVQQADVVYAVPGHPFVGEATVTALMTAAADAGVPVTVVPGVSFVEPVLTAVQADALDGLQLFDAVALTARHVPPLNPDVPLLLGQVYSRLLAGDLKLTLMTLYPDEHEVVLVHAAGEADQRIEKLPLYAIDRSEHINHLTSLYVPALPYPASLPALAETVAILRSPGGCPWDQEQTPQSMRDGLLEETSEVLEALDQEDATGLQEELGDLLYHLVMQTQMATETADFQLTDVIAGIDAKLKYRHPHVWGDWEVADTAEVLRNWELLKQQEKSDQPHSLLDSIPRALPALARSQKIQKRVKRVGFDWPDIGGVYEKLAEEIAELQAAQSPAELAAELGDILFVVVNLAKWLEVDAESALREANARFSQRFQQVEKTAAARNINLAELTLDELEQLWQEAKAALAGQS